MVKVIRFKKGQDLLIEIKKILQKNKILAAIPISSVGCISKLRVRDASGVNIKEVNENLEIICLNGTLSKNRIHLHISCAKEDLSVIGGHLVEGTIINTTCELSILCLNYYSFSKEFDENTGYDELNYVKKMW